jgi:hypothetical protein
MTGLFGWLFGRAETAANATESKIANPIISLDDPRYESYASSRRSYWEKIGAVDSDVIAYLISPEFQGAPAWPTTRQAFMVIRNADSLIIASDGMSDLFVNTDMTDAGFRCEVYIEVAGMGAATFDEIKESWAFSLIENFARNVADRGGIADDLERLGVLSMEMPAPTGIDASWVSANGSVGVLIGISTDSRAPKLRLDGLNEILMIPITVISPNELDFVVDGRAAARNELASKLSAMSNLSRQSTV